MSYGAHTVNIGKLSSVKTYSLVAFIFSLLVVLAWFGIFLFYVALFAVFAGPLGFFAAFDLVIGIFFFIMALPSIFVTRRTWRMYQSSKKGDVSRLKQLNSMGWAIVALIFTGVIPGVMMLIAHGPIDELGTVDVQTGTGGLAGDSLDRIAKLKSLLDSGAINQQEFDSQKNAILHPQGGQAGTSSPEEELKRVKTLYDSGGLTEAEYTEQKRRILSRM